MRLFPRGNVKINLEDEDDLGAEKKFCNAVSQVPVLDRDDALKSGLQFAMLARTDAQIYGFRFAMSACTDT